MTPPGVQAVPIWFWIAFNLLVLAILLVDLGVFQRRPHVMDKREAAGRVAAMVALAILFNLWVFYVFGRVRGLEFLTGYLIEYSLSVDNIFVFIVILGYFDVSRAQQHRVLFWGIVGALVLRGAFIAAGAALLSSFAWISYVFGAFLILTGVRLLRTGDHQFQPERNPVVRFFRRFVPMTPDYRGARFWVQEEGRWIATPLLVVLLIVDVTDVLFAVDSIPAIFAVTRDPFIVYTSNAFAILGLRALYFLLVGVMEDLKHLKTGLALVLMFVGLKMTLERVVHVPVGVSLGVVAGLLGLAVAASLWEQHRERTRQGG